MDGKDQWIGVFSSKVWIFEQSDDYILYKVYKNGNECEDKDNENLLKQYFQLDLNLTDYYKKWSEADPYFKEASQQFYGIRILKQDIVENIFSFICSSNNNITRLQQNYILCHKYVIVSLKDFKYG